MKYNLKADMVQVSLVIFGRYVPSFWTGNPEFAYKKSIFVKKIVIFKMLISEFADKKSANNEGCLYYMGWMLLLLLTTAVSTKSTTTNEISFNFVLIKKSSIF